MKKSILQFAFIALAVSVVFISGANAKTINVASPYGSTQVQSAIDAATAGDTVYIPTSNVTWTSGITLNKNITLQGAGKTSTFITWNTGGPAITASGTWHITGISMSKNASGGNLIEFHVGVGSTNWRIDHCSFTGTGLSYAVMAWSPYTSSSYGVADHNDFINCVFGVAGLATSVTIDSNWTRALNLGTYDAIYIEDNTFTNTLGSNQGMETDGDYGARVVFRYNTVTDMNFGAHSVQGDHRAFRSWEYYNNTFIRSTHPSWVIGDLKGGTGVVYNNTIIGNFASNVINLQNVRSFNAVGTDAGICAGASNWDGNTSGGHGYPCRDQIGRSTDAHQWTTGDPYPTQALSPAYFWNNFKDGTYIPAAVGPNCTNQTAYHILENRDFYNYNASFNGTTGVGSGLLANRPATCTTNSSETGGGVAYWATDTKTLYRCSTTNTWTVHYKPYIYPHPLTLTGPTPPNPPQALRIVK